MSKSKQRRIKSWAIIGEDGKLAHHHDAHAVYQTRKQAMEDTYSDGSDKVIPVEIILRGEK